MRKINDAGLALIKSFEGLRLKAYLCPADVWTIGYGHTRTARPGMQISSVRATNLLREDLAKFEAAVANLTEGVTLTDNQFSALVSLTFNIGVTGFSRSTLLKLIRARDFKAAAGEFKRWNKARGRVLEGLTRRRAAEAALFVTP